MTLVQSTDELLNVVRTRLLTFMPPDATETLAQMIGTTTEGSGQDGKLYKVQAPDKLPHPYGLIRLIDLVPQGDDGRYLERGVIELQFFHRPRRNMADCEAFADRARQAWHRWVSAADGISALRVEGRATITYTEPADRELVQVRMLLPFRVTAGYVAILAETT